MQSSKVKTEVRTGGTNLDAAEPGRAVSVLPESVTQRELNEQNRKYWEQPASKGEKFGNE